MDIDCLSCSKPWEDYHLRHDAVSDALREAGVVDGIDRLAATFEERLSDTVTIRGEEHTWEWVLEQDRWQFVAHQLYAVVRCPACPPDAYPYPPEWAAVAETAALFANDLDGLAIALAELTKVRRRVVIR